MDINSSIPHCHIYPLANEEKKSYEFIYDFTLNWSEYLIKSLDLCMGMAGVSVRLRADGFANYSSFFFLNAHGCRQVQLENIYTFLLEVGSALHNSMQAIPLH